ncbi:MAG: hypothetical protein IJ303_06125 [Clostridia bacterium]|nr:hypothetical protein [Clostridia bacterium]
MRKEDYRDYATHMFRIYAAWGCRDADAVRTILGTDLDKRHEPMLSDIAIVNAYLELCRKNGKKHIADAVSAVYFAQPKRTLRRGDISARALRFALDYHISEKQVYAWLREARRAVAGAKGLDVD